MIDRQLPGLGRIAAPDSRDHQYLMRSALAPPATLPKRLIYKRGPTLDQGGTSTCVGHAWRAWLSGAPLMTKDGPSAFAIYDACLPLDEWPSNDTDVARQDGTSVRAGAKVLTAEKRITTYLWAFTVDDVRRWILGGQGGCVFGVSWYDALFDPDKTGVIRIGGRVVGGHAIYAYGADDAEGMVYLQNSWGSAWGGWMRGKTRTYAGCVRLPYDDLARLLAESGEACTAVEQKP